MTDYDAVKQTIDVLARADLLDEIASLLNVFIKHKIIPSNLAGYDLYFYCYTKAKQFHKAIEYGTLALAEASTLDEKLAVTSNLATVYVSVNKPTKAIECYDFIAEHTPLTPEFQLDYSAALYACNKKQESFNILKQLEQDIWKYDAKLADSILFNLGVHYIHAGEFKQGIEHLSIGRKLNVWGSYSRAPDGLPEWDGTPQPGKHVLLISEGGIGDEIINIRFVKNITDMGMTCSLLSTHGVDSIYDHLPFCNKITAETYVKSDYAMWVPIMELARKLNVDSHELWTGAYLQAKPEFIKKYKDVIVGDFKVGLRWAGNPRYDHELHRTINLTQVVKSIPNGSNWTLYSVQRDIGMEQLEMNQNVTDLSPNLTSFDDLLGVIYHFDLVVTSCTSVAHAAAAMGKPVIILIPIMGYHTWAEGKQSSSWYGPNLRLIRQQTPETWVEAYDELSTVLGELT
jgi:tetratricopeptide (TPR) repeat protein